jgi:hypothetical protein
MIWHNCAYQLAITKGHEPCNSPNPDSTPQSRKPAKATLEILHDAMAMERNAFRERLERFLKQNGFEI